MSGLRELSFNLGIGSTPQAADVGPDMLAELYRIYNALNTLGFKLDEYTGAINAPVADRPYIPPSFASRDAYVSRFYVLTANAITAKTLVNIYSGGVRAAVSGTYPAHGIVLEDTAAGNYAPVAMRGVIGGFVGLTVGGSYFTSASAGAISSSGTQKIGFAVSTTELGFGYLI